MTFFVLLPLPYVFRCLFLWIGLRPLAPLLSFVIRRELMERA
jgi:hypothetical protein